MADEIIAEVRRIRHEISEECGHDLKKVVEYHREFQDKLKQYGNYRFFKQKDDRTDLLPLYR